MKSNNILKSSGIKVSQKSEENLLQSLYEIAIQYEKTYGSQLNSLYKKMANDFYQIHREHYSSQEMLKLLLFYRLGYVLKSIKLLKISRRDTIFKNFLMDMKRELITFVKMNLKNFTVGSDSTFDCIFNMSNYFSPGFKYLGERNLKVVESFLSQLCHSVTHASSGMSTPHYVVSQTIMLLSRAIQQRRLALRHCQDPRTFQQQSNFLDDVSIDYQDTMDIVRDYYSQLM
jgi:hypothetical protein